ncbi:MAG TPA: methylated-DNA--[protein]-cysteine S-methyltransferase, partial [Methanosarcina sp.]|nr:methylated-DNA--[protein]-cysteine S-methyltransferase [Methanosarcina sp.]
IAPHTAKAMVETPWGTALITRSQAGLTGLWFDGQKDHPGVLEHVATMPHDPLLRTCAEQLCAYGQGLLTEFDLPLDLHGTDFQRDVWRALLKIPDGRLTTYGALARQLDRPDASRAIGAAVGMNPVAVIVPCHRVVGRNGALTGYSGGLQRKIELLRHEGATISDGKAYMKPK